MVSIGWRAGREGILHHLFGEIVQAGGGIVQAEASRRGWRLILGDLDGFRVTLLECFVQCFIGELEQVRLRRLRIGRDLVKM